MSSPECAPEFDPSSSPEETPLTCLLDSFKPDLEAEAPLVLPEARVVASERRGDQEVVQIACAACTAECVFVVNGDGCVTELLDTPNLDIFDRCARLLRQ